MQRLAFQSVAVLPILVILLFSFQNCSPVAFREIGASSFESNSLSFCTANSSAPECAVPTACHFNGQALIEGSSVTVYQNSSVPFGSICVSESRVCTNGQLSGSYNYANCFVGTAASCLFDGKTIPHNGTVKGYQKSSVKLGEACTSEDRVCTNGQLSGSYSYSSCSAGVAASCLFNGQTVGHGQTVKAYEKSNVNYGQTCISEDRVCTNGQLSGSYSYNSCSAGVAASCLFGGQSVAHGQNVVAYASSFVGYGQSCSAQSRSCNNGTLSGSYAYSNCTVNTGLSCSFNGQSISHGGSVYAYASSSVPQGQSCQGQSRSCYDGSLSGSYANSSCTVNSPPISGGGGTCTPYTSGSCTGHCGLPGSAVCPSTWVFTGQGQNRGCAAGYNILITARASNGDPTSYKCVYSDSAPAATDGGGSCTLYTSGACAGQCGNPGDPICPSTWRFSGLGMNGGCAGNYQPVTIATSSQGAVIAFSCHHY